MTKNKKSQVTATAAGIGIRPTYTEPGDLLLRTSIHGHIQSGGEGSLGGFLIHDAYLEPNALGPDGDGLVHNFSGSLRIPKDVHHVDRLGGYVLQTAVYLLAVETVTILCHCWVHWKDLVAVIAIVQDADAIAT